MIDWQAYSDMLIQNALISPWLLFAVLQSEGEKKKQEY